MRFMRAVIYPFNAKEYAIKRLGLAYLISLIPIMNFAFGGYLTDVVIEVANNRDDNLPTWHDFSAYVEIGFKVFVAQLVYYLIPTGLWLGALLIVFNAQSSEDPNIAWAVGLFMIGLLIRFVIDVFWLPAIIHFSIGYREFTELFDFRFNNSFFQQHTGLVIRGIIYQYIRLYDYGSPMAVDLWNRLMVIMPCLVGGIIFWPAEWCFRRTHYGSNSSRIWLGCSTIYATCFTT
jgi:hypothetical protein